jgi:hypothetical protein
MASTKSVRMVVVQNVPLARDFNLLLQTSTSPQVDTLKYLLDFRWLYPDNLDSLIRSDLNLDQKSTSSATLALIRRAVLGVPPAHVPESIVLDRHGL